jgi:hypothetical protein
MLMNSSQISSTAAPTRKCKDNLVVRKPNSTLEERHSSAYNFKGAEVIADRFAQMVLQESDDIKQTNYNGKLVETSISTRGGTPTTNTQGNSSSSAIKAKKTKFGEGGYFKYQYKNWISYECPNWVWVNRSPCLNCVVRRHN